VQLCTEYDYVFFNFELNFFVDQIKFLMEYWFANNRGYRQSAETNKSTTANTYCLVCSLVLFRESFNDEFSVICFYCDQLFLPMSKFKAIMHCWKIKANRDTCIVPVFFVSFSW